MKRLPEVVLALNSEVIRLTGKKLVDGIKDKLVEAKSSMTYSRPVGLKEKRLDSTGRWSKKSNRSCVVSESLWYGEITHE